MIIEKKKAHNFLFLLFFIFISHRLSSSDFYDSLTKDEKKYLETKKKIIALCDYNFPPFEFISPETKSPTGFNSELIKCISNLINIPIIITPKKWEEVIPALLNNEGDIIQGLIFTKEREETLLFSIPFIISSRTIFFNKKSSGLIKSLDDLKNKKAAVQRGDVSDSLISGRSEIEKIYYSSQKDGLLALQNNMVDAFIGNKYLALYLIKKLDLFNIDYIGQNIHTSDYCIGFQKKDAILKNIFDKALKEIKNSSEYDNLFKKWFPEKIEPKYNSKIYFLIPLILIVISFFFILTFILVFSMRKAIRGKTEKIYKTQDELILQNAKLKEANEQLKKLDTMKDNFLSNVSHELRTPLVSILGYMNLIENGKLGVLDEKQDKAIKIVRRNIDKLLTMITTLLDVIKIEQSFEKTAQIEFIDLVAVVNNNIYLYSPLLEQRKIAFSFDYNKNEKYIIKSKRQFVEIIISNVFTNAIKYNRDGGNIFIELTKNENWFILIIQDSGIGIDPANIGRVFEKFYQVENKITANSGGFGLGLYLVKKYLELLNGKVELFSKPGEGSTFKLYFDNREKI